jgi:hypothetical protein
VRPSLQLYERLRWILWQLFTAWVPQSAKMYHRHIRRVVRVLVEMRNVCVYVFKKDLIVAVFCHKYSQQVIANHLCLSLKVSPAEL